MTIANADAMTIATRVANEENALQLGLANSTLAELDAQDTYLRGERETYLVFKQLGDATAEANIARIDATITENDAIRVEQQNVINEIEGSRRRSDQAGALSNLLAAGTDESIAQVIADAEPIISEFV